VAIVQIALWQKKAAGTVEISSPEEERKLMKGKKNSKRTFIDHTKAGRQVDELSEEKKGKRKDKNSICENPVLLYDFQHEHEHFNNFALSQKICKKEKRQYDEGNTRKKRSTSFSSCEPRNRVFLANLDLGILERDFAVRLRRAWSR